MQKKKVLIVEDELDILEVMCKMCEIKNCLVFKATNAQDAWQIFQREKPDAVSIDILLAPSEFDGLELLRKIREIDKSILCVLVTRIDEKEKIEEAKKLGADSIFIKPLQIEELDKLVQQLVTGKINNN
ncbi:MAG: response regulator [Candidatus Omnitrophica bacterium]|nr:response regulator [Candidatus Omnitrophota bacterium]